MRLLNPFTPEAVQNPYPVHEALRKTGVVHVEDVDTWVVSRYADVEAVLADTDRFTARYAAGGSGRSLDRELLAEYANGFPIARTLIAADPPEHRWYRLALAKRFAVRSVRDLEPFVTDVVTRLMDDLEGGSAEMVPDFALPIPLVVFCALMGVPDEDLPLVKRFNENLNDSFTFEVVAYDRAQELEIVRGVVAFQHYIREMIESRRATPGEDLLSQMITSVIPGLGDRPLSDLEIMSTVMQLLNAGTETTMNLISNGIDLMLRHPEQCDAVRADPGLLVNFVDEVLRFESPVQCLFRNAKVDVDLGGVTVPRGGRLAVMYGAANRDPRRFDDPDRFNVTRSDASQGLYFGKGEHFCLGAHLARLEGRVAFRAIIERFDGLERDTDAPAPTYRPNPLSHGLAALPVRWDSDVLQQIDV
jgi:cytochrome P450